MTRKEAMEYIIKHCNPHRDTGTKWDGAMECAIKALEEPERKKGKWIKKMLVTETKKYKSYDPKWYCACCGTEYDPHIAKIVNFCYVCGADMRGKNDEVD